MRDFRTKETKEKYLEHIASGKSDRGCALCDKDTITDFKNWRIVLNNFPYDRISETHHMLVPKEHVVESDLSSELIDEFSAIKNGLLGQKYDFIAEGLPHAKSIPEHLHYHLLKVKDFED